MTGYFSLNSPPTVRTYERIRRTGHLIGDCSFITADHYTPPIPQEQAQEMADIISATFKLPKYTVQYIDSASRRAKYPTHGSINQATRLLKVFKPSAGLIIHEMAHALDYRKRGWSRHDKVFRQSQREIFNAWHGTDF